MHLVKLGSIVKRHLQWSQVWGRSTETAWHFVSFNNFLDGR